MLHTITSDARPSVRHQGWWYAYYDKASASGRACTVVFPGAVADLVKTGFQFDSSSVRWDDSLRASVLELDFHEPEGMDSPSLPPDPEAGWGDPDYPAPAPAVAVPEAQPAAVGANGNGHNGHGNHNDHSGHNGHNNHNGHAPMRPPAYRRHQAQQQAIAGAQLPAAYLKINLEVARSFQLQLSLIGSSVSETRRADVAQKLCAIASIPYFRQVGIELTEDDIKNMTL